MNMKMPSASIMLCDYKLKAYHESEIEYQFSNTIEGACNLDESSLELCLFQF